MIVVTLNVDAAAAVRAGRSAAGPQRIELGDDDISALPAYARECLAKHLERLPGWGQPLTLGAKPIGVADVPALVRCLGMRMHAMLAIASMSEFDKLQVRAGARPMPFDSAAISTAVVALLRAEVVL